MVREAALGSKRRGGLRGFLRAHGKTLAAYGLVLPAVLFRAAYTIAPLFRTVWLSLTNASLTKEGTFIGLANYAKFPEDTYVRDSIEFTLFYVVVATVLEVALGLGIAVLLNRKLRLQWLTRASLLLPWGAAAIVVGIMWRMIFFEAGGVANDLVLRFNLAPMRIMWLSEKSLARFSVILSTLWKNSPWAALLLLAGLKTIPRELLEAAEVDGAGPLGRFRHISLPLLAPMLLVVLMLRGMAEVNTYGQILSLTRGGPGTATKILAIYAADRFFMDARYGYGSALVLMLLVLTVLIGGGFALILARQSRR